jgi:hypothetical protein
LGVTSTITGNPVTRSTGGPPNSTVNASSNTGDGGGGGNVQTINGGSGVVILRYPANYTISIGAGLLAATDTVGIDKITTITSGAGSVFWTS